MGNNTINMNKKDLDDAYQKMRNSYLQTDDVVSGAPKNFSQIKNTGLFSEGFSVINGQINSVSTSLNNMSSILKNNTEKFFDLEKTYAAKAEDIEIPIDFVKYDSREFNSIDDITLNKRDGESINTYKPSEIGDDVEYSGDKEKLDKVKVNNEYEEASYDSTSSVSKEELNKIYEDETQEQSFEDNYRIDKVELNNQLSKETSQSEYDDRTVIEKEVLEKMNTAETTTTTMEDFNDNNRRSKSILRDIHNDLSLEDIDEVLLS